MRLAGVIGERLLTHIEYLEEALKKRDEDVLSLKRALEEKEEEFQNLVAHLEENDTQHLRAMEEMVGRWEGRLEAVERMRECNCPVGEHEDFLDESTHVFLRSPLAPLWLLHLSLGTWKMVPVFLPLGRGLLLTSLLL